MFLALFFKCQVTTARVTDRDYYSELTYSSSTQTHRVNYWKTEETVRRLAYVHCVDTNLKLICTELKSKIQVFFPNNYSLFWHICVLWIHFNHCTIQLMFHLCWWTENLEQQTFAGASSYSECMSTLQQRKLKHCKITCILLNIINPSYYISQETECYSKDYSAFPYILYNAWRKNVHKKYHAGAWTSFHKIERDNRNILSYDLGKKF